MPNFVTCLCLPLPSVALHSFPNPLQTRGGNMNIPNVDVMNQVTNVTNEPHSHVVVWMGGKHEYTKC